MSKDKNASTLAKPKKLFELTDAECEELREAFNLFDKDGAGTISKEEVRVSLTVLGFSLTQDEMNGLLALYGGEKSNEIGFDEFLNIVTHMISQLQPKSQLIRAFNFMDKDKDGYINLEDLQETADFLGEKLSKDELREMVMNARGKAKEFDIHTKDVGSISQAEFVKTISKVFN